MGTWLSPILLWACASPMPTSPSECSPSRHDQARSSLTPTKTLRVLSSDKAPLAQSLIAIQGRLISPDSKLPVAPGRSFYVVDITDPDPIGSCRDKRPAVVTRTTHGFAPDLCIVRIGKRVRFDNHDKIFHTLFSSSAGNEFDLAPLDPGNSAFLRFQKPGLVHVYCSQHSGHRASILVLPAGKATRVDADGRFHLEELTKGRHVLELWGPGIRGQTMEIFVTGRETSSFDFPIQSVPAKAGR